jgi:proteasome lid subunit RPN8/RPN11
MSDLVPSAPQGMVFGTPVSLQSAVSILEMPFPSARTLHWVPKSTRLSEVNVEGGPEDVDLVITQEGLLATSRHVSQTLEREMGGFLLGNRYRCPTGRMYVLVDQFVEGEETESDPVSLHFTHESWRRLEDKLATTYIGKVLVGWYHSHPRMNIFLSRDDLSIHERRFSEPWKSALVLEPQKHFGGFFCWRGGRLNTQVPVDFYEMLRDETRKTVVAWENYTGVDPIKNITPPLAEANTKSVQPTAHLEKGQLIPARRRPWARPALVAVAFSAVALSAWQLTQRHTADDGGGSGPTNQGPAVTASPVVSVPAAVAETTGEQAVGANTAGKERQSVGGGPGGNNREKTSGTAGKPSNSGQSQASPAAVGGGKNKTAGGGKKKLAGGRKQGGASIVGPHGKG